MQTELMQSKTAASSFKLDPRTKILMVFVDSTILITGSSGGMMNVIRPALAFLPLLLFLLTGRWKTTMKFACIYLAAYLLEIYVIPLTSGFVGFIIVAMAGIFTRFIPGLAIGYYLVSTTTVSEFIASMERMHIPRTIVIPFAVMFRFFPTVGEESRAIGDAMRMRGISLSGIITKPLAMLEYRLVPLMMSTVKIGEELSAAALTGGLGNPVRRTNICKIGFSFFDALMAFITIGCLAGYIVNKL
jgi:energy-coupling factor transporter transmembrane protein EcfT